MNHEYPTMGYALHTRHSAEHVELEIESGTGSPRAAAGTQSADRGVRTPERGSAVMESADELT